MAKLYKFNTVIDTISNHVTNNKLVVCCMYNHKKEKSILEYRVYSKEDPTVFMNITKFQAKKHLTQEQKEFELLFEEIRPLFDKKASMSDRMDLNRKARQLKEKEDLSSQEASWLNMCDCIKNKSYKEV